MTLANPAKSKSVGSNLFKYASLGIVFVVLPFLVPSYILTLLVLILIYSIFSMSTDLLVGYTGMFSLGQAAFWGVGAYVAGFLVLYGINFYPAVLILAIAAAIIISGLIAYVAVRVSGIYFLLVSFAFAEMLFAVVWTQSEWTRGELGLAGISRPLIGFPFYLNESINFYFFVLGHLFLSYLFLHKLVKSPFGLVCQGIRENEPRIRALGYNVFRYKVVVFVIAGIFSSIAGVLAAYFNRFASPDDLSFMNSAMGLLMIIIGGAGTLTGAILGAAIMIAIKFFVSTYTVHWPMIVGAVFIICILFFPRGVGIYLLSNRIWSRE
jgi:branched-chain amino acid transport system permease protein